MHWSVRASAAQTYRSAPIRRCFHVEQRVRDSYLVPRRSKRLRALGCSLALVVIAPLVLACDRDPVRSDPGTAVKSKTFLAADATFETYQFGSDAVELALDSSDVSLEGRDLSVLATIHAHAKDVGGPPLDPVGFPGRAAQWHLDLSRYAAGGARALRAALDADTTIRFMAHAYRTRSGTLIRRPSMPGSKTWTRAVSRRNGSTRRLSTCRGSSSIFMAAASRLAR